MTGREREALERRVRSIVCKLHDLAPAIRAVDARTSLKMQDTALALEPLLDGPLRPGAKRRAT